MMDSIRNDQKLNNYLRISTLCTSKGGNECKLLTITEDVHFCLDYFELLKIQNKKGNKER